jgi:hypothetical protein
MFVVSHTLYFTLEDLARGHTARRQKSLTPSVVCSASSTALVNPSWLFTLTTFFVVLPAM